MSRLSQAFSVQSTCVPAKVVCCRKLLGEHSFLCLRVAPSDVVGGWSRHFQNFMSALGERIVGHGEHTDAASVL